MNPIAFKKRKHFFARFFRIFINPYLYTYPYLNKLNKKALYAECESYNRHTKSRSNDRQNYNGQAICKLYGTTISFVERPEN